MPEITAPPEWFLFLLWPFKGEPCYPQIEGDLNEEFQQDVAERGNRAARRRYFREVLRNVWFLFFRWITMQAIVLPAVCITLIVLLPSPLFAPQLRVFAAELHLSKSWMVVLDFFIRGTLGLSLGIACSQILRGHERMLRLAFIGYVLLSAMFSTLYYGAAKVALYPTVTLLVLQASERGIWIPICFSMGSIWAERHHRRRSPA